jgi:hypothetical protein
MGYRSDVAIAFVFSKKEQIDEVLAIYQMRPFVSEHDLVECWTVRDWDGVWGLTYSAESIKWYDSYEDVQGLEDMVTVVETFAEERGDAFPYAYCKLSVGEEDDDIERVYDNNDAGSELSSKLFDRMDIHREIQTNF